MDLSLIVSWNKNTRTRILHTTSACSTTKLLSGRLLQIVSLVDIISLTVLQTGFATDLFDTFYNI
jgi:hypothetical protein